MAMLFFVLCAIQIVVLARFGLLALMSYSTIMGISTASMFTFDTSRPYFTFGLLTTAVAFAFVFYGWKVSLAGRPLISRP